MAGNKLRYYRLYKQNMITKANAGDYGKVLKEHIGLHSTDYLTPYLSLWARVKDLQPKALFADLNDPGNAVRLRAFRGTVFVIHRDNLTNILAASKIFLAAIVKENEKFLSRMGFDLPALEQNVVQLFSFQNELTVNELKKQLPPQLTGEFFSFAIRFLEFTGILVRTNHRYISDRVIKYGLMTRRYPEIADNQVNPEEALTALVLDYIKKFGPACPDDLSWWLAMTKTAIRNILTALTKNLVSFDLNNQTYFMEKTDFETCEDFCFDADRISIINFLPYEDHFPKGYSVRDWFLPDPVSSFVYREGTIYRGQVFPSIWLNGQVIGGWEMTWLDKAKTAMTVEITNIYEKQNLSKQIMQLIEDRRLELENFINEKLVPLMKK